MASTYSLQEMVTDLHNQMDVSMKLTAYLQKQNEELANQVARLSTTATTRTVTQIDHSKVSFVHFPRLYIFFFCKLNYRTVSVKM
jgi:uncharacterized protein (DUF302 family)